MRAFGPLTLTEQALVTAKRELDEARIEGDTAKSVKCEELVNDLLDRLAAVPVTSK